MKVSTVWVNGCFDNGLHYGQFQLLKHAKSLGDVLIVGIDSDRRIRESKGVGRPVITAIERGEYLDALESVALVVEFDTDEELEKLISFLEVDIMVVGSDYRNKKVIGSELVKEVVFFERIPSFSTTELLKNNY